MFGAIAGRYDLVNRLHSMGMDQVWRRRVVREAGVGPEDAVLDVACGTGDLSEAFARAGVRRVVGVDFTAQMLERAREKMARLSPAVAARLEYREGDAMALDLPDSSFDAVSIAFGIRNVTSPAGALREFYRVLRPGGRLVVLEFVRPRGALSRRLNELYCGRIMPWTATLVSGDRSGAYRYLPRSVGTFMEPAALVGEMSSVGFGGAAWRAMTLGICAIFRATRPA